MNHVASDIMESIDDGEFDYKCIGYAGMEDWL